MEEKFTWVPLYEELAKALLKYRNNRGPLVVWIYAELGKITRSDGRSLVEYLHMEDGSQIKDIDPLSVFGIFNRNLGEENRTAILEKFKDFLGLTSEVPKDFSGIPTLNPMKSFFFHWDGPNVMQIIEDLWTLFEKVVKGEDNGLEEAYDRVLNNGIPKFSFTMMLFCIAPKRFLALDSRNRDFMKKYGFNDKYSDLHYKQYKEVM